MQNFKGITFVLIRRNRDIFKSEDFWGHYAKNEVFHEGFLK